MSRRERLGGQEQYQPFDEQDRAALHALDDDFAISGDGEVATVDGDMKVTVVRLAEDGGAQLWLTIRFPGGEELDVKIRRARLLEQLDIES